jgi:hypothetical protein
VAKFDYQDARDTAKALIDEFGAGGSFVTPASDGGIDAATGDPTGASPIVKNGVVTPILDYEAKEIDGTSVLSGDGKAFFYGAAPSIGDVHVQNDQTWRVVGFSSFTSVDGIVVYAQVQLRK